MLSFGARRFGVASVGAAVRRGLLLGGLVFAALPVGSAAAMATVGVQTVGQAGTPLSGEYFFPHYETVFNYASMPKAGIVGRFQTQSSACDSLSMNGTYDFQVLRPLGNSQYLILGDTGDQTDPCNSQLISYRARILVHAGDVLGVYTSVEWMGVLSVASGTTHFASLPSEPGVGATVTLSRAETGMSDVSATLVFR